MPFFCQGSSAVKTVPRLCITCAVEWCCPIYGTPNVAAMIHRHDTVTNVTRVDEWNHFRHVIPTEMKWSGGIFSSGKLYLAQVIFAT